MTLKKPTNKQLQALYYVKDGSDVHDYTLAGVLRSLERDFPKLLQICKPQMWDGTGHEPFFGAIATPAGKRALIKAFGAYYKNMKHRYEKKNFIRLGPIRRSND